MRQIRPGRCILERPIISMKAGGSACAHRTDRARHALVIIREARIRRNIRLRVHSRMTIIRRILRRNERLPSKRRVLRICARNRPIQSAHRLVHTHRLEARIRGRGRGGGARCRRPSSSEIVFHELGNKTRQYYSLASPRRVREDINIHLTVSSHSPESSPPHCSVSPRKTPPRAPCPLQLQTPRHC